MSIGIEDVRRALVYKAAVKGRKKSSGKSIVIPIIHLNGSENLHVSSDNPILNYIRYASYLHNAFVYCTGSSEIEVGALAENDQRHRSINDSGSFPGIAHTIACP